MGPIIGFAVATGVASIAACICWAWLSHTRDGTGENGTALILSVIFSVGAIVFLVILSLTASDHYHFERDGVCQVGIDEGTYQAQVIGEHDGMVRLVIEVENDDEEQVTLEYRCRLIPASAFKVEPLFSEEFQTLKVVKDSGFTQVTIEDTQTE